MKILVEKAVIEQALEALESAPVQYDFNSYPMLVMTPDTLQTALTALRDALAEPELNLNCKSVQKRLATVWGYVKAEQAEQEPVAIIEKEAGFETEVYATGYADSLPDGVFKLYTAPVRTKDLTDEELWEAAKTAKSNDLTDAFRAVIAADREKNR